MAAAHQVSGVDVASVALLPPIARVPKAVVAPTNY
jgi:hypothetical protein